MERPGLPGRKLFTLAAQSDPGAKTQSVPLEPFPRCLPTAGAEVFLELGGCQVSCSSGDLHDGPPCEILYVLGKPQAKGLPPTVWCCALRAGCAARNKRALRHRFSDVRGKCQSCMSGPAAVKHAFCAQESHPESGSDLK